MAFNSGSLKKRLGRLLDEFAGMDHARQQREIYNHLRDMWTDSINSEGGKLQWLLLDQPVCRSAWFKLTGWYQCRVDPILKCVKEGKEGPPEDGRSNEVTGGPLVAGEPSQAHMSVDAFLNYLYENLAEPLAAGAYDSDDDDSQPKEYLYDDLVAQEAVSVGTSTQRPSDRPKKYLEHMSQVEFFEMYLMFVGETPDTTPASKSTFWKVYVNSWKRTLRIRGTNQHAKCADCQRYKEMLRKVSNADERMSGFRANAFHLHGSPSRTSQWSASRSGPCG